VPLLEPQWDRPGTLEPACDQNRYRNGAVHYEKPQSSILEAEALPQQAGNKEYKDFKQQIDEKHRPTLL